MERERELQKNKRHFITFSFYWWSIIEIEIKICKYTLIIISIFLFFSFDYWLFLVVFLGFLRSNFAWIFWVWTFHFYKPILLPFFSLLASKKKREDSPTWLLLAMDFQSKMFWFFLFLVHHYLKFDRHINELQRFLIA